MSEHMSGVRAPENQLDVIHDIGYRHYEGPRLSTAYATRSLYTSSLRGAFGLGRSGKSKILPMAMVVIMALPALIMVAVSIYIKSGKLPVDYPNYLTDLQFVTAVFTAAQAPVLLSRDLRFMTVPLYFSRPLRSADYVRAKYAAMVSAVFILTLLPMLIMWIGSMLGSMDFGYNLKHFAFGVAAIIALFMVSEGVAGALRGVLHVTGHQASAFWISMLNPGFLIDSTVAWMFGLPLRGPAAVPTTIGGIVFLAEMIVLAAGTYALLIRRYRKI